MQTTPSQMTMNHLKYHEDQYCRTSKMIGLYDFKWSKGTVILPFFLNVSRSSVCCKKKKKKIYWFL